MQQDIIRHDLFLHGTQYFQIVIRIRNDNRCLQTIAPCPLIQPDQSLMVMLSTTYPLSLLNMSCKALTVQLHGIQSDVNQYLHTIIRGDAKSMLCRKQRSQDTVNRCINLTLGRYDGTPLPKNTGRKCCILYLCEFQNIALQ